MRKPENKPPRDRKALVDFLNHDFGGKAKPSWQLAWFLAMYKLNSAAAKAIQGELRRVLFLYAPNGKRELGELIAAANKYPRQTMLIPREDNQGVETWTFSDPKEPRSYLYGIVITAIEEQDFDSLRNHCKNCHRAYWRKSDFCQPQCARDYNNKQAKIRMANLRKRRKKERGK